MCVSYGSIKRYSKVLSYKAIKVKVSETNNRTDKIETCHSRKLLREMSVTIIVN